MRRRVPPLPPRDAGGNGHKPPPEHAAAREALVERIATQGLIAGFTFKQLVAQLMAAPTTDERGRPSGGANCTRKEAEERIRKAEADLRDEMAQSAQLDRVTSLRRLKNATRKIMLMLEGTADPSLASRLAHTLKELEERLARMQGWDEPERMHVVVTTPNEQLRKVLEEFDEERFNKLAAEALEHERVVEAARGVVHLLPAGKPSGELDS
jgi:hypothetical protein